MKLFVIFSIFLLTIICISIPQSASANDAAWNGWVEIGDGPNPDPDNPPIPPDPPDPCGEKDPSCPKQTNSSAPDKNANKADDKADDCPKSKGSPIYMQTGSYVKKFIDARYPTKGPWLAIARAYNSQDLYNGIFGFGWVSHNAIQLFKTSDGTNIVIVIRLGDGRRARFAQNSDGSYTPTRVLFDFELTGDANSGWTLNEKCAACGSAGGPRMEFDPDGFLASISDDSGNAISYNYAATSHRLLSVTDPEGSQLSYSYNSLGKVSKIETPDGLFYSYLYDQAQNLIAVINPINATNKYYYDATHRLIAIINPLDQTTVQIQYDDINRVTSYTEFGKTMTLTYSISPAKYTIEHFPNGSKNKYYYNDQAVITKIEYMESGYSVSATADFTLDDKSNITAFKNTLNQTTYYVYDDAGNVIKKTDAMGGVYLYQYDSSHNVIQTTDPLGRVSTFTYNSNNQVTRADYPLGAFETFTYNSDGLLISTRQKNGLSFEYTYDAFGNILSETEIGVADILRRTSYYSYNARGNRLSETDYNGNTISYEYDLIGRLIRSIYPSAGTNLLFYNLNNQLYKTEYPNGSVVNVTYDNWAREASRTHNNGYAEVYTYNNMGLIEYVYSPSRTNQFIYDSYGKIIKKFVNDYYKANDRNKLGNIIRTYDNISQISKKTYDALNRLDIEYDGYNRIQKKYTYDAVGNKIALADYYNNTSTIAYDALNRPICKISPLAGTNYIVYNQYSLKVAETNALGGVSTYTYNDLNRLIRTDFPNGSFETSNYDDFGNLVAQTQRNGATLAYTYNPQNNLTSTTGPDGSISSNIYNSAGLLQEEIDAVGHSLKYFYDTANNPVMTIGPANVTNIYQYNLYSQQTLYIDASGKYQYKFYDAFGHLIQTIKKNSDTEPIPNIEDWVVTFTNDIRGRVIKKIENSVTNTYTYDDNNRKKSVTFQLGHQKSFDYDYNGNLKKEYLPNGNVITYSYNKVNQISLKQDNIGDLDAFKYNAAGLVTNKVKQGNIQEFYTYDSMGQKTAMIDGYGNPTRYTYYPSGKLQYLINRLNQTNTLFYDDFERVTAAYDGNGTLSKSNVYNAVGFVLQKIDAKGQAVDFLYNAAGQISLMTYPDGQARAFSYNAIGKKTSQTDEAGNITLFEYDGLGQLTKMDMPGNNDSFFFYDSHGNRTCISNLASVTYFTFDASKRITSAVQDGFAIDYTGLPSDDWIKINYPGGKEITRTLDKRRRITEIADLATTFANITFNNRIVTAVDLGNTWSVKPSFGANLELTNLVYKSGLKYGLNYNYVRNKINQKDALIDALFPTNSIAYSYDNAQRLKAVRRGLFASSSQMIQTNYLRSFGLDSTANITNMITDGSSQERNYNNLNQLTDIAGSALAYDVRGNLINDGVRDYYFDYQNQLIAVHQAGICVLSNVFDAANRLVRSITPAESRYFVYDGNNIIEEYLDANLTTPDKQYILSGGIDSLIAYQYDGHTYYYLVDDNQTIMAAVDENGDIAERYKYSAYGETTFMDANNVVRPVTAIANSRLYTGRRWLPTANTYYYRSRFYSPEFKRFISRDPAEDIDTLNLYLYVYANPVNFTDPLGLSTVEFDGGPTIEVNGDCVKTSDKYEFDGKRLPIMKSLFKDPATISLEWSQNICKSCCGKDSKHPGEKWPSITYGFKVAAEVSTGWVAVPSLSIKIPKVTTIGLSVSLTISGSFSLEFGHDSCYDSFTGGGEGEFAITAGACFGAGSCEESDEENNSIVKFSLVLVAEMSGKVKASLKNAGTGFVLKIDVCFEAKLIAKAEVEIFWGWAKAGHEVSLAEVEETCITVLQKKW